jgi:hypothetical protein
MGYFNQAHFHLDLDESSVAEKNTVDDFLGVIGSHSIVHVTNIPSQDFFEANIVIPGEADLEESTLDYLSLSTEDKEKVESFMALLEAIAE